MDLKILDNKLVRLVDTNDDVFEGYVCYNSPDYNDHEFGRNEECLQMIDILFYKNDIKEIKEIDSFSGPYSKFEELNVDDVDLLDEVLTSEDEEHKMRMLNYLENYVKDHEITYYNSLVELLTSIKDEKYKEVISRILNILG